MDKAAIIILAAGMSRRAGVHNKLLRRHKGKALFMHSVAAAQASKAGVVIIVTGHEADFIRSVLGKTRAIMVHNPDYRQGMSSSLKAGIAALPEETDAALICLADMPDIDTAAINRLFEAHDRAKGALICVPVFAGRRGNPVLWDRRFFTEMQSLKGDQGARSLIKLHKEHVCEVQMRSAAIHFDIDL